MSARRSKKRLLGNEKGVALVAVLWTVMLMTLMVQGFMTDTTTSVNLTRNFVERARAKALADGAVYIAIDTLLDRSAAGNSDMPVQPISLTIDGARISIVIEDEGGKIDLNRAPSALLIALFESAGVTNEKAAALADAIADWRDRDSNRRLHGAEDQDYRSVGRDYGAKDRAFEAVDELRLLLGMTPELYAKVAPALTVHSKQRGVDPLYAPPAVLRALAKDNEQVVEALLATRAEGDGVVLASAMRELGAPRRFLSRSHRHSYTIQVRVEMPSATVLSRTAIVELKNRRGWPFEVVDWRN